MGVLDQLRALFGRSVESEPETSTATDAEHEVVDEGAAKAHDLGLAGQVASQGSPTGVPSLADRPISTEHGAPQPMSVLRSKADRRTCPTTTDQDRSVPLR
jgi:hypothetical protein